MKPNRQVQISAPCLPLDTGKLLRATRLGSQPAPDHHDNNIDGGKASFSSASPAWLTPLCPPGGSWQNRPASMPTGEKTAFPQAFVTYRAQ